MWENAHVTIQGSYTDVSLQNRTCLINNMATNIRIGATKHQYSSHRSIFSICSFFPFLITHRQSSQASPWLIIPVLWYQNISLFYGCSDWQKDYCSEFFYIVYTYILHPQTCTMLDQKLMRHSIYNFFHKRHSALRPYSTTKIERLI